MLTCSIIEACKIWAEFHDCLHGRNGYGGNVCEIYSYRLQQYCPTWHRERREICGITAAEIHRQAAKSLVMLLREFCREYDCGARIDNANPDNWYEAIGKSGHFDHRCHIDVRKAGSLWPTVSEIISEDARRSWERFRQSEGYKPQVCPDCGQLDTARHYAYGCGQA